MGTKTIGLRDDVYDRLKARKRDDESFTDLVDRLLEETTAEWREGFGTLNVEEAESLQRAVEQSREQESNGLVERQHKTLEEFAAAENTDETA